VNERTDGVECVYKCYSVYTIFELYNVEECRDLVGSLKVVENDVIQ